MGIGWQRQWGHWEVISAPYQPLPSSTAPPKPPSPPLPPRSSQPYRPQHPKPPPAAPPPVPLGPLFLPIMAFFPTAATRPAPLLLLALVVASAVASTALALKFTRDGFAGDSSRNCDFVGNDLVLVRSNQCSLVCKHVLGCTHWTWRGDLGSACYLKTGGRPVMTASYNAGNVACGYMH
eukprot:TRINITY_DN1009_c0_g1_i1.p1 TRINITY_DN1009_c0_g1~~TRINITY_DN1009_c0_g1_i1.p1  ORF type:complete len:179 (+),score=23.02 TRINITY_DN1009_c0_g1_i1:8-544(+)